MKVISYSLFGDPDSFEFPFYLRGIYFNARMNRILYPDWSTRVHYGYEIDEFASFLGREFGIICNSLKHHLRCKSMLWRMMPIWEPDVTHVLCRDADAITTYRESKSVERWLKSGMGYHGMNDDPAHSIPLMGGMIGIKTDRFKLDFPELLTWTHFLIDWKLDNHGTDQDLLMKKIYPRIGGQNLYLDRNPLHIRDNKLWESDLTCRMIGSPGVVDFELLRFFKRFDANNESRLNASLAKLPIHLRKHFYWI